MKWVYCHSLQNLKKQLAAEQQSAALLTDEISALHQTINRLTALIPDSTANADSKNTLSAIVSENLRLRADKSRLIHQVSEVQTSLSVENKQMSKMVCLSEALCYNGACSVIQRERENWWVAQWFCFVGLSCKSSLTGSPCVGPRHPSFPLVHLLHHLFPFYFSLS